MTDQEKQTALLTMVDPNTSTDILNTYLNIAKEKVLNRLYPFDRRGNEIPSRYEYIQLNVAAYLINKRGAEGETAHSENGVSRSYGSADVPDEYFKDIVPYVGLII